MIIPNAFFQLDIRRFSWNSDTLKQKWIIDLVWCPCVREEGVMGGTLSDEEQQEFKLALSGKGRRGFARRVRGRLEQPPPVYVEVEEEWRPVRTVTTIGEPQSKRRKKPTNATAPNFIKNGTWRCEEPKLAVKSVEGRGRHETGKGSDPIRLRKTF